MSYQSVIESASDRGLLTGCTDIITLLLRTCHVTSNLCTIVRGWSRSAYLPDVLWDLWLHDVCC
jgi:hypothetical protein